MASRHDSIGALLKRAENSLNQIEKEYRQSLEKEEIHPDLKIDIKNLCENLRSILDYVAHDIRETHCASGKEKIYFPIMSSRQSYESQMKKWYPGLETACPELWAYLESIQPYHQNNGWLSQFNQLTIDNKHKDLVDQIRIETERVHVKMPQAQVSWDPRAVTFGQGVSIGGVPVNPATQMPEPSASQTVERIRWVDFKFEGINVSALWLLKKATSEIAVISNKINQWL